MTSVETQRVTRRSLALVAIGAIALAVLWFVLSRTAPNDAATKPESASVLDERSRAGSGAELVGDVLEASPNAREPAERVVAAARDENAQPGRILHVTVSDEHGQPLAGVDVTIADVRGKRCGRATTRRDGTCEFTIPLRAEAAKDTQLAASISTRAPGRRDAWQIVRESEFHGGDRADVRVVLGFGAELHLELLDVEGAPASRAVVLANWVDDGGDPASRDKPDGAVAHYRTASDARGHVDVRGVLPGKWTVRTVAWREWLDGEPRDIVLAPGAKRTETWTIESRPRAEYTSGVVTGLVFSGDGTDTSGFYLRRASDRQPTIAVLSDGAFFSDDDRFLSDEWELYERDGESRGGSVRLQLGRHDLVLHVPAK